jgi:hypothetical protein
MTDEQQAPQPDVDEAPGWVVRDPEGNIVQSGPISEGQAAFLVGEADQTEGDK